MLPLLLCYYRAFHANTALCHIQIHKDKMAGASAHDKEVEDLVGAEAFMLGVKNRQLEGVDDAADGVDNSAA